MKLPRMIRNLWIYRRLFALTVVLGLALAFVASNREELDVHFPFLGSVRSWSGVVMLASAALGAAATWLVMTFRSTLREARQQAAAAQAEPEAKPATGPENAAGRSPTDLTVELPPGLADAARGDDSAKRP